MCRVLCNALYCTQIVEMCQTGKLSNWFLRPRRIAVTGDLFSGNNECLYLPYPRDSICCKMERKIIWLFGNLCYKFEWSCQDALGILFLQKRCQGKLHRFSSESWVVCLIYCVKIASIFFILTLISDKLRPGRAMSAPWFIPLHLAETNNDPSCRINQVVPVSG